jgi:SAM-dependent methyltransferase
MQERRLIMQDNDKDKIKKIVRQHYGKKMEQKQCDCCCGGGDTQKTGLETFERFGYSAQEVIDFHGTSYAGLCCGNPLVIAGIKAGEAVLDLGSGAGFDFYLAAKQVGETGYVIGVDMTTEMINQARENMKKWDFKNIEFRLGEIENLPVDDGSVDVIISNCVINLSPDKPGVFKEAFRVLKPGGRLAISDIVATTSVPEDIQQDDELYCKCIGGAASIKELEDMLIQAGFKDIRITPNHDSRNLIKEWTPERKVEDFVVSASIEARKPAK